MTMRRLPPSAVAALTSAGGRSAGAEAMLAIDARDVPGDDPRWPLTMRILDRSPEPDPERRLRDERVLWLGTTAPDGAPHLVPVWFTWDGSAFLVFSKPRAVKVRHIAAEPRVAIALGEPEDDFDVQLVDARAELLDRPTAELLPPAMLAKYADEMTRIGLGADEFAATYSQAIRIVPTRFLPWRGRTWLSGRLSTPPADRGRVRTLVPAWA
jgi:PPOX class probable F420-dependent enzyme